MRVNAVTAAGKATFFSGNGLLCWFWSPAEYALYRNAQKISEVIMKDQKVALVLEGKAQDSLKLLISYGDRLTRRGLDASRVMKEIVKTIGGGGGGSKEKATGGGPRSREDLLEFTISEVKKDIKKSGILLRIAGAFS